MDIVQVTQNSTPGAQSFKANLVDNEDVFELELKTNDMTPRSQIEMVQILATVATQLLELNGVSSKANLEADAKLAEADSTIKELNAKLAEATKRADELASKLAEATVKPEATEAEPVKPAKTEKK